LFRAPGLLRGQVVDWINLPHFPWTFNLADASISCAAILIAILALRGTRIDGTTPAHADGPAKGLGGPQVTQEGTQGDTGSRLAR
jgi:signal peptidase II